MSLSTLFKFNIYCVYLSTPFLKIFQNLFCGVSTTVNLLTLLEYIKLCRHLSTFIFIFLKNILLCVLSSPSLWGQYKNSIYKNKMQQQNLKKIFYKFTYSRKFTKIVKICIYRHTSKRCNH